MSPRASCFGGVGALALAAGALAVGVFTAGGLAAGARADDGAAAPAAFVEVAVGAAPRTAVYVGEVVALRVRVGVDATFVPARLVPLVRQRLDLPLHVEVPLLRGRPALVAVAGDGVPGAGAVTLALNDDVAAVTRAPDEVRDGVTFAVFQAERRLVFDAAGAVRTAGPTMRFAVARDFHDDLVFGRVPRDRRDVAVEGRPFEVRVLDLPTDGRPANFGGAVGRFSITATSAVTPAATAIDVGRPFRVTLRVEGPGNLARIAPIRLGPLDGFHVFGALDEAGADVRTTVFEVAAERADVAAFPAIPFAFFDPTPPAGYRVVATAPIPLTIRGADGGNGANGANEASEEKAAKGREARAPRTRSPSPRTTGAILVVFAAAVVAVVTLRRRRAARRAAAADPAHAAVAAAIAGFRIARGGDPLGPLVEVLAAHLRTPTAAVIAPGLALRLAAAGLPARDAQATADLVEACVGARYGGAPPADVSARANAAVAAVEAAHRARASRGRRGGDR